MSNIKYVSLAFVLGSSLGVSAWAQTAAPDNDAQEEACLHKLEAGHSAHVKQYVACVKAAVEGNEGDESELEALDDCDDEYQEAIVSPSEVRACISSN